MKDVKNQDGHLRWNRRPQTILPSSLGEAIVRELRFDNTMDGASDLVKLAKSVSPDVKAVLEPSANYWLKVYDRFEDEGVSASFVGTRLCCIVELLLSQSTNYNPHIFTDLTVLGWTIVGSGDGSEMTAI